MGNEKPPSSGSIKVETVYDKKLKKKELLISATDDKGPATKVPDNTCIENVPIRGGDSTENVLIREPLKDIDVNIVRERITQDLETDKSTLTKRRTGFIATGLSSFQVVSMFIDI